MSSLMTTRPVSNSSKFLIRQPPPPTTYGFISSVYVVRLFTQEIEHLRKGKGHDKVVGGVGIADDEECRRPSVAEHGCIRNHKARYNLVADSKSDSNSFILTS